MIMEYCILTGRGFLLTLNPCTSDSFSKLLSYHLRKLLRLLDGKVFFGFIISVLILLSFSINGSLLHLINI